MLKLLIVDDERPFRQGIRYAIDWESHGIEVVGEAANGQDAIELIKDCLPDIIITDIVMPVIDGVEFSKIVRNMVPDIYIIVLSAYFDLEWMQKTIAVGVNDYLLKNADASAVLEAVLNGKACVEQRRNRISGDMLKRSVWNNFSYDIRNGFFRKLIKCNQLEHWCIDVAETMEVRIKGPSYIVALCCAAGDRSSMSLVAEAEIRLAGHRPLIALPKDNLIVFVVSVNNQADILEEELSALGRDCGLTLFISPQLYKICDIGQAYSCLLRLSYGAFWLNENGESTGSCIRLDSLEKLPASTEAIRILEKRLVQAVYNRWQKAERVILQEIIREARAALMPAGCFKQMLSRIIIVAAGAEWEEALKKLEALESAETLEQMLSALPSILREARGRNKLVENAIRYIDDHYAESLSLSAVADSIFVSPNYLSHIFRSDMGIGFREYIVQKRISEAKKLLKDSDHKINEIAVLVGFKNYKQFSEHFLNNTGMSAKQFRREMRGN